MPKLQRVQNSLARAITNTSKYEHITPVLKYLHWLPVQQRISFKLELIVYKTVNSGQPQYLKSVPISRLIIIQRGHLIIFVWSYLNQELFLVNELFPLLDLLFGTLFLCLCALLSRLCHFVLNLKLPLSNCLSTIGCLSVLD